MAETTPDTAGTGAPKAAKRPPKSELTKAAELVAITWAAYCLSDEAPAKVGRVAQLHGKAVKRLMRAMEGMP